MTSLGSEKILRLETSDIKEDGSFQCPECGKAISAKDESDRIYKTESWTFAEGTRVIEVNLRCHCGIVIRLEGSDILKATGFGKEFGDPEDPEDDEYWLEWLDARDESPSSRPRPRSSIPFWD